MPSHVPEDQNEQSTKTVREAFDDDAYSKGKGPPRFLAAMGLDFEPVPSNCFLSRGDFFGLRFFKAKLSNWQSENLVMYFLDFQTLDECRII